MNQDLKSINKFLSQNAEFEKITREGKTLRVKMRGSTTIFLPNDFSIGSNLRKKLNELEATLGLTLS